MLRGKGSFQYGMYPKFLKCTNRWPVQIGIARYFLTRKPPHASEDLPRDEHRTLPSVVVLYFWQTNMKKIFCLLLLVSLALPGATVASLVDEIDSHLEQLETFPEPTLQVPAVEPAVEPLAETDYKRKYFLGRKIVCRTSKAQLREAEQKVWQNQSEKFDVEQQIFLLDQERALLESQLKNYQQREAIEKEKLVTLTKQKSDLQALVRVGKRQFENTALRNFLRRSHRAHTSVGEMPDSNFLFLQWLFSKRSLVDVISQYQRSHEKELKQKANLTGLSRIEKELSKTEAELSKRYAFANKLTTQMARHKKTLNAFLAAEDELQKRLALTEQEWQVKVDEYRAQQAESTLVLQDLRQKLGLVQDGETVTTTTQPPTAEERFVYPVDQPVNITAYFHDSAYEQRFGLRHDGVDFFASQGSPVYAMANGTVAEVKDNGLGYSYVIVEHQNDLFTLYGHVSGFLANEGDTVTAGQKIALSGGTPGTRGAGYFTTGPHLHFEVFRNGDYQDPLQYLPDVSS